MASGFLYDIVLPGGTIRRGVNLRGDAKTEGARFHLDGEEWEVTEAHMGDEDARSRDVHIRLHVERVEPPPPEDRIELYQRSAIAPDVPRNANVSTLAYVLMVAGRTVSETLVRELATLADPPASTTLLAALMRDQTAVALTIAEREQLLWVIDHIPEPAELRAVLFAEHGLAEARRLV